MSGERLSAYELERADNIRRNQEVLRSLGIENPIASKVVTRVKGAAHNKKPKAEKPAPRARRSLRAQNLDPEGKPLPDKEVLPSPTPEPEPKRQRLASVPLDATKVSLGTTSAHEASTFLARLSMLAGSSSDTTPTTDGGGRTKTTVKVKASMTIVAPVSRSIALEALSVREDDIAKLVPDRIFSLEMHPADTKLLVAAGDTWGRVGLWDVDAGDDQPVVTFSPHSRPVTGLRVLPSAPHQLLSCSQDGAVRCLNLTGGASAAFVELYRAPEDAHGDYASLHGLSRTTGEGGAIAIARSDGVVVLMDSRVSSAGASSWQAHDKKIFGVDFSPLQPCILASASLDRTVRLWDVRTLGGSGNPKPLVELSHGLSVTAARFSPSGAKLLTTCNDDLLRVYAAGAWLGSKAAAKRADESEATVKHNNKTGQYLTPFQAEWVRGSDDVFACGSLAQPRGVDVFHADGSVGSRLEHDNVTSVISLLAWHPSKPVLAASNSSGKVFLWRG